MSSGQSKEEAIKVEISLQDCISRSNFAAPSLVSLFSTAYHFLPLLLMHTLNHALEEKVIEADGAYLDG
ncbi:MAG TPA: hypothetical protein V6C65_17355, partial [Allocoleopsis sp.]